MYSINMNIRLLMMTAIAFCAVIGFSRAACGDIPIKNRRYNFVQFVPTQGMLDVPLESKFQVLHVRTAYGVGYSIDVGQYAIVGVRETTTQNLAALQKVTDLHLHLMSKTVHRIVYNRSKLGSRLALRVSFQLTKRWKKTNVQMDYVCILTVHRGIQYTFTIRSPSFLRFNGSSNEPSDQFESMLMLLNFFSFTR